MYLLNVDELITQYTYPFCRLSGLLLTLPVLNHSAIPKRIRIIFALALTVIVTPFITSSSISPLSLTGFGIILFQIFIGISMGFVLQMILQVFILSAQIVSMQSGLGFASLVNPAMGNIPLLGQFYFLLASLIFLSLNGHMLAIELLVNSFQTIPIAEVSVDFNLCWQILIFFAWVLQTAVLIILPVIISLLLINIAFGVLTRATPQINIITIGFPITLALSFVFILVNLYYLVPQSASIFDHGFSFIQEMIGG